MSYTRSGAIDVRPAKPGLTVRRSGGLIEAFLGRLVIRTVDALCAFPSTKNSSPDEKDQAPTAEILVTRFDGIGDVVMTVPMLRALKRGIPNAKITFITRKPFLNLVSTCPYIDHLVGVDPPPLRRAACLDLLRPAWTVMRDLTATKTFSIAINPRPQANDPFTALLIRLSDATYRIGYQETPTQYPGYRIRHGLEKLLTNAIPRKTTRHEVEMTFDLLRQIVKPPFDPGLELTLEEADRKFSLNFLQEHGFRTEDRVVAIAPGCGDVRRIWPKDRFVEISKKLIDDNGYRILIVGGPYDLPIANYINTALNNAAAVAVGNTSLRQAAALFERSSLFIGNDSGPMHIAAAMGIPVIEISCHPANGDPGHANSPVRFGPWNVPHRILQPSAGVSPCVTHCASSDAHCIKAVTADAVMTAVWDLLPQSVSASSGLPNYRQA